MAQQGIVVYMKIMSNDLPTSIRLKKELKSKLQAMAAREHRSLSNFIQLKLTELAEKEDKTTARSRKKAA